jgi:hypothetical protein
MAASPIQSATGAANGDGVAPLLYKLRAKCAERDKVSKNQKGKLQELDFSAATPDSDLPSLKQGAKTLCSAKRAASTSPSFARFAGRATHIREVETRWDGQ